MKVKFLWCNLNILSHQNIYILAGVSVDNITKAMNNWASKTCVTFKELTGSTEGMSYLSYQIKGGCFADVGMQEQQATLLSLKGRACDVSWIGLPKRYKSNRENEFSIITCSEISCVVDISVEVYLWKLALNAPVATGMESCRKLETYFNLRAQKLPMYFKDCVKAQWIW